MTRRSILFALALGLAAAVPMTGARAAGCEGRYEGLLTVKSANGMSVAPLQWTVRADRLYGAFEGPGGLYMVEGRINATCAIVAGAANDYDASAPMPLQGTVTEGVLHHNGPVTVSYKMQRVLP